MLRWTDTELMTLIANETQRKIQEFSPQGISNTVWALASLQHLEQNMMAAAAAVVTHRIQEFSPQEVATTAWAFSTLQVHHDGLLVALGKEASRRGGDFNESSRSTLSGALMQLEVLAGRTISHPQPTGAAAAGGRPRGVGQHDRSR